MTREIPKRPELPQRFNSLIDKITDVCFLAVDEQPVDVVFCFGSSKQKQQIADHITRLFKANISRHFIITGGPVDEDKNIESIADAIYSYLDMDLKNSCTVAIQNTSTNSKEDIEHALHFLQPFKTSKIGCVARNWAIGRQSLYLQKYMPQAELIMMPYNEILDSGIELTAENWHQSEEGSQRVWGEVLRLDTYGNRSDIFYPSELKAKIDFLIGK